MTDTSKHCEMCDSLTNRALRAERRNVALAAERDALQAKLDEAVKALEWLERNREEAERRVPLDATEDEAVKQLCDRHGYGAVMDSASRQWARISATGAFYVGGCLGDTSARAALAKIRATT